MRAPAAPRRATDRSKAAAGSGRSPSSATVTSSRSRAPRSSAPRRSGAGRPSMIPSSSAQSSTLRASGPMVSKVSHSGTVPVSGKSPAVVLRPTRSFQAAGIRTDPPVSDPIAAGASPKATEAAAPDEDPPATASGSLTDGGVAVTGFSPSPEKASSDIWVFPRQTSPARVARASTSASAPGVRCFSSADPASVAVPAVSNRSFQDSGTPSSSPLRRPALARPAAAIASARARSGVTRA